MTEDQELLDRIRRKAKKNFDNIKNSHVVLSDYAITEEDVYISLKKEVEKIIGRRLGGDYD